MREGSGWGPGCCGSCPPPRQRRCVSCFGTERRSGERMSSAEENGFWSGPSACVTIMKEISELNKENVRKHLAFLKARKEKVIFGCELKRNKIIWLVVMIKQLLLLLKTKPKPRMMQLVFFVLFVASHFHLVELLSR